MRPVIFTCILFVIGGSATAQLSILPQVGTEITKTTIIYNDIHTLTPLGGNFSPQVALRLNYTFKQLHGPFLEMSTGRSLVSYQFTDPENGMKSFRATAGNMQLRMEGGYQFSSKPLYFNKSKAAPKTSAAPARQKQNRSYIHSYSSTGRCGKSYSNSSRQFKTAGPAAAQALKEKEKGWYMAIQPLIGAAVMPTVKSDLVKQTTGTETSYVYNAGNWSSALVTGAGFEFGKNVEKKFVVTVQYLKGLGNLDNQRLTTMSGAKETVTQLRSGISAWSIKAGIPIRLSSKKTAVKQVQVEAPRQTEKRCEYKSRCSRVI